jgi:hypothetical protein
MVQRGVDIRVPHIHGNRLNAVDLGCGQLRPEAIQTGLGAFFGHVQNPRPIQIVDQREIAVSLRKSLFVDAQVRNSRGLPSRQSANHRPFLDGMNFVPTQMQLDGHRLQVGGFHPVDGQPFEHGG